jgi:hypothetical protein
MGLIIIPGNMTFAMLAGSDVEEEARQQMITMFMIATSNALSCIIATYLVLKVCINSERRIRMGSFDVDPRPLCSRTASFAMQVVACIAGRAWIFAVSRIKHLLPEVRGSAMAATSISS